MLYDGTFNGMYNIVSEIFEAPERELIVWIEQNTKHFMEFNDFYKNCGTTKDVWLDTQDREHVYAVIGLYFLKKRWPTYGDETDAYKNFLADLNKAIIKYKWKLKC